jgi:hypothetical protein
MNQVDAIRAVHYEPDTGYFFWNTREDVGRWWNLRYSGKKVGGLDAYGYLTTSIGGETIKLHRLAWIYVHGYIPDNMEVDHVNGDRSDNRIKNLRLADDWQNAVNAATRKDNKSGAKGVSWHSRANKWQAQINIEGKRKSLGYFDDIYAASNAYKVKAEEVFGPFMRV